MDDDPMSEINHKLDLMKKTSTACKDFADSNAMIIFE